MMSGRAVFTAIGPGGVVTRCVQVPGYASLPVALQLPSGERLEGGAAVRPLNGTFQAAGDRHERRGAVPARHRGDRRPGQRHAADPGGAAGAVRPLRWRHRGVRPFPQPIAPDTPRLTVLPQAAA